MEGQPLTKGDLLEAMRGLRSSLHSEIETLKSDLHSEIETLKSDLQALRSDMHTEIMVLRTEMTAHKDGLTEEMRKIETNLLTDFHRYAKGQQSRMHTLESNDVDLRTRVGLLEDRILTLESRRPPSV